MAEYIIQGSTLDAIADAINAKTGGSSAMSPAEMVTEIGNISTGGGDIDTSPYTIKTGSFTPVSDTTNITIPIDPDISDAVFFIITDAEFTQDSPTGTTNTVFGGYYMKLKAFFGTSIAEGKSLFGTDGNGVYDYWGSGVNCGYNAGVITCNNSKSLYFKASKTYNYTFLGV